LIQQAPPATLKLEAGLTMPDLAKSPLLRDVTRRPAGYQTNNRRIYDNRSTDTWTVR